MQAQIGSRLVLKHFNSTVINEGLDIQFKLERLICNRYDELIIHKISWMRGPSEENCLLETCKGPTRAYQEALRAQITP